MKTEDDSQIDELNVPNDKEKIKAQMAKLKHMASDAQAKGDHNRAYNIERSSEMLALQKKLSKLGEGIPKDTTYGVVVDGKYIAKGNKKNMRRLAKEKGGQLMNSPSKKVGDDTGKINEGLEALTEQQFDEAAGEKDACYHKVKSRYKVWPSAYASGALVKCRKVGAKNWGNSDK